MDASRASREEIRPGPQLNVVLGPNGSGKSTLVCAMVLGLGGSPSSLGRAKELREFIKYGYKYAAIETEIKESEYPNFTIRRSIYQDNTSKWWVNNEVSTHSKVLDLVRSYNIYVDNLCQFLPQDRVSAFAAMDSSSLLRETELIIGGESLLQKHIDLINLKSEESKRRVQVEMRKKHLTGLKEQNMAIEHEVARFKERKEMTWKLEVLEKKRHFLVYEKQKKITLDLKAAFKNKKLEILEFEKVLSPLTVACEEIQESLNKSEAKVSEISREVNESNNRFNGALEEQKGVYNNSLLLNNKFIRFEEREERRILEIKNLNNSLEVNDKRLKQVKALAASSADRKQSLMDQLEELKQSERNLQIKLNTGETDMQGLKKRFEIVRMQLDSQKCLINQRRSLLSNNLVQLYDWIMANDQHHSLQYKVYGPLMFEINVNDERFASMMEKVIPKQYRTSFLVQSVHDRNAIYLKSKSLSGNPPLIIYNPNPGSEPLPILPASELSQYGIQGFLSDIFDAPPLVKAELCRQFRLNEIPYGSDIERHLDRIFALKGVNTFLSYTNFYHLVHSKYGSSKYTVIEPIKKARQLVSSDQEIFKVTQNNYMKLEQEMQELNRSMNENKSYLGDVKQQIYRVKNELEQLIFSTDFTNLEVQRREIMGQLSDMNIDPEEERREIQAKIEDNIRQQVAVSNRVCELSLKALQKMNKYTEQILRHSQIYQELKVLKNEIDKKKLEQRNLYEACNDAHESYLRAKELASEYKVIMNNNRRSEEDYDLWDKLPNDVKKLDSMKAEIQVRISSIPSDPGIMEKYESRAMEIEKLSSTLEFDQSMLKEKQLVVQDLKNQWVKEIAVIVEKVNLNFSKFFSKINCCGCIEFHRDPDDQFEKYGIVIMVSYRSNESAKRLDSRVQSGGERSVATMIYLISLQQLSECPIRLVDEINQGMDQNNERIVFNQMVELASMDSTPQYFLITPKLLPNLFFSPNIDIICVFNGPYMVSQKEWLSKQSN